MVAAITNRGNAPSARSRDERGFTMAEMLVAVMILVILMGVAFVAVQRYQRSMKRVELDETARSIFVAAQNHLAVADAQGLLDVRAKKASTKTKTEAEQMLGTPHTRDGRSYRCLYVAPGDARLRVSSPGDANVLNDMLPALSLDDTVRTGGSYLIEYDLESATVTGVYYSDQSPLSRHTFTDADYEGLFVESDYRGNDSEAADKRRDGFGAGNAVIGWYGGEDLKGIERAKLYAPKVEVINAERLEVRVSFTATALNRMVSKMDTTTIMQLNIKGMTSGNPREVNPYTMIEGGAAGEELGAFAARASSAMVGTTLYRSVTYVLDDITSEGGHFAQLFCTGDKPLIPGEDIEVWATVFTNGTLANVAESIPTGTNSLFGWKGSADSSDIDVAYVANMRHLENLDADVSGYDLSALNDPNAKGGRHNAGKTKAEQISDLVWAGDGSATSLAFLDRIAAANGVQAADVQVYPLAGTPTKPGTYRPVVPRSGGTWYLGDYDGGGHSISNVSVDATGNGGLFGEVHDAVAGSGRTQIRNVDLVNFDVRATGDAGALAGKLVGCDVVGVAAYNEPASGTDAALGIRGGGSTGGLVGAATDAPVAVDGSAAAVYVNSTGGYAGGLVGFANTSLTLTESYAAGHTVDGAFLDITSEGAEGRVNVMGNSNVGGLVGDATQMDTATDQLTIKNCYSTASVLARTQTAGGLVGGVMGGSIDNSYAANLVLDGRSATNERIHGGGIVGWNGWTGNGATITNCHYLSLINPGIKDLGNDIDLDVAGAEPFDKDVASYRAFTEGTSPARPYDQTLIKYYQGTYPYQTIQTLAGMPEDAAAQHLATHYGDWPLPETFVVNVEDETN